MTANISNKQIEQQTVEPEGAPHPEEVTTRYATILLKMENGRGRLGDESIHTEPAVTRERLYQFNLVDNETVVMLYSLRGNLNQARTVLKTAPTVLNYDVVSRGNKEGFAYVHCTLREPVKSLVATLHEFEVVLDLPLEFTDDGTVRTTLIGKALALRQALKAISDIVEVHLEKTGTYRPGVRDLGATLTDRQYQILAIAVEQGYYEVPRRITLKDIVAEIGCSQATVGEHLQKIEAKILSRVVR